MKNLPSIFAAIVLISVFVLYMCTYQVRSTEVAIIKTFGEAREEPVRVDEDNPSFFAGLNFKWPWPIQSVQTYDTRIKLMEDRIEEAPTKDSKPIILTTYTGWVISDPYKFHRSYRTVEAGENALRQRIRTYKKAVIGQHDFSDFVSTNPEDRKLDQIEQEMMSKLVTDAKEEFGIEVRMFGIKQLGLPKQVTEAVFQTMKQYEQNKAERYTTEGDAEASRIVAEAEQARRRILAFVDKRVGEIRSEGLAKVAEIYRAYRGHEELRIFLDRLRSLETILADRATLILDTTIEPITVMDADQRRTIGADPVSGLMAGQKKLQPQAEENNAEQAEQSNDE